MKRNDTTIANVMLNLRTKNADPMYFEAGYAIIPFITAATVDDNIPLVKLREHDQAYVFDIPVVSNHSIDPMEIRLITKTNSHSHVFTLNEGVLS